MSVWNQLDVDQAHKTYAILGIFSILFCLLSLVLKERLFVGEAFLSTVTGIIVGPHAINLVNPLEWGNSDYLTQEISRIILIIQIFSVSVELPKKYMKINAVSVIVLLLFTMISGWLITGLFTWLIFPKFTFIDGLAITAAITATDPVLAAAIVGKGKFGERIPAYIRHLLSAESGANDGLAFPFVLLSVDILTNRGKAGIIVRDWFCIAVLYECVFGVIFGVIIGFLGRKAIIFCENRKFIDRESLLIFYILLSLICTGFGSILGVDDLLVSFAAGAAFAWDGWFSKKTHGQHLSNSIDLLLNVGYFLYFGTIIPWQDYNNKELGLYWWRLVILGLVIIFLRRIPAALMAKPFVPAIKTWKEAIFVGHFGPVGVGGIFCSIITKDAIEKHFTKGEIPIDDIDPSVPYYMVLRCIWPIVSFIVVTSILVHGFSVTAMVLYSKVQTADVNDSSPPKKTITLSTDNTLTPIEMETYHEQSKDEDHKGDPGSSHLHFRRGSTRPGVLLGKNEAPTKDKSKSQQLKFYRIGHEILVEDLTETIIKKYKWNVDDPETDSMNLQVVYEHEASFKFDDLELKNIIKHLHFKR